MQSLLQNYYKTVGVAKILLNQLFKWLISSDDWIIWNVP